MELLEPEQRFEKSALRRGWLLVLVVMVIFIVLTKVFPAREAPDRAPPVPLTGVTAPSH
jgi:hypothetical protein